MIQIDTTQILTGRDMFLPRVSHITFKDIAGNTHRTKVLSIFSNPGRETAYVTEISPQSVTESTEVQEMPPHYLRLDRLNYGVQEILHHKQVLLVRETVVTKIETENVC